MSDDRAADWATDASGFPVLGPELLGFDPDDEREDDVAADDAAFVTALLGTALRDEPEGGRSPLAIMAAARVAESDGGEVHRVVRRERRSSRIRRWVGGAVAAAAVVTFAAVVVPNLGSNSTSDSAGSMADNASTAAAATAAGTMAASSGQEMAPSGSEDIAGGGEAPATSATATSAAASSAAEESLAAPVPAASQPPGLPTAQQTLTSEAAETAEADKAACALPALPDPALAAARTALGLPADTAVELVTGACDVGVIGAAVFPGAGVQVVVAAPGSVCAETSCPVVKSGAVAAERAEFAAQSNGERFVIVVSVLTDSNLGGNLDPQLSDVTTLQQVADSVQAALN